MLTRSISERHELSVQVDAELPVRSTKPQVRQELDEVFLYELESSATNCCPPDSPATATADAGSDYFVYLMALPATPH